MSLQLQNAYKKIAMNYHFVASFSVYMIVGCALLLVWRRQPAHRFVRDIAWSTITAGITLVGYLLYSQAIKPFDVVGFMTLPLGSVANIMFLVSAVAHLTELKLSRKFLLVMTLLLMLIWLLPMVEIYMYWALATLVILTAIGVWASLCLWKKTLIERLVGPLLIALGLNQLIVLNWGESGLQAQVLAATLIRLSIALVFMFAALERTAKSLQKSSKHFELLTENSHQGVIVTDGNRLIYANPAALAIYGHRNVVTLNEIFLYTNYSLTQNILKKVHRQLQEKTITIANWDGHRKRMDGKELELKFSAWSVDWDGVAATQILITDETASVNSARDLMYQATHDELTGLPNRYLLMQRLKEYCVATDEARWCALIVLNIARFKLFNQSHGHTVGDNVLKIFAEKLKDLANGDAEVMRLGGDEFAVLVFAENLARDLTWRLQGLCLQPIVVSSGEFFIDVSIGMASYPFDASSADTLLRAANAAMHQAKRTPGTFLVMAEKRFEEISSQAFEQEQALRKGIKSQEIYLQYQPKVDAASGRLLGFEALARWNRPGIGHVSPVEFIAVAERTGLIAELGSMLLTDACRQIARWCEEFGDCVPVAVNVSPMQLLNPGFLQLVEDTMQQYAIAPRLLTLEITESAAIDNLEQTQIQLQTLRDLGVKVAMDDFGTGYSSLSMLRNLPLHTVKIDRALIDPLPSPDAMAVVTAICQLAAALNLRVVAEGVETQTHADAAHKAGCHELQGYYFARPMTHGEAAGWLARGMQSSAGTQT